MADGLDITTDHAGDLVVGLGMPVSGSRHGAAWRWQWTWSTAGATRTW